MAVFPYQGVCEAGTPVMEYKGMLGLVHWAKWFQVKLHAIKDLCESLPWGWALTSPLLTGEWKNITVPSYFDLSFSETAFLPFLDSLVTPRAFNSFNLLNLLKTVNCFHLKVTPMPSELNLGLCHSALYYVPCGWKLPPVTHVVQIFLLTPLSWDISSALTMLPPPRGICQKAQHNFPHFFQIIN